MRSHIVKQIGILTITASGFVFAKYVYKIVRHFLRQRSNAPTPNRRPIFGNALEFDVKSPLKQLTKWSRELGDIYRLDLMMEDVIVLSGEAIYEALVSQSETFAGRPDTFRIRSVTSQRVDMTFQDSSHDHTLKRKAFYKGIKNYGEGFRKIEDFITDEIQICIESWEAKDGTPFDPYNDFYLHLANIISLLINGSRLDTMEEVDEIREADVLGQQIVSPSGEGLLLDLFPVLRYFGFETYKKIKQYNHLTSTFTERWITKSKTEFDSENIRGLMDHLLAENVLSHVEVKEFIKDATLGGVTTTHASMYSGFLVLLNRPDIQVKLQREIDDVFGEHAMPSLEFRQDCTYTEAFVMELLRYSSVEPLGLPHKTLKDTTIGNYFIPANTQVWMYLFGLSHDERVFPDPWTFTPERFLDENGQVLHDNKLLMPFGAGRRMCVGENIARARLFLFFTALLRKFTFLPPEGAACPSCDPRDYPLGLVIRPSRYNMRAILRQ